MKKAVFLALPFLFFSTLFQHPLAAQDSTRLQTLFGNGARLSIRDIGLFAAPTFGVAQMDGSTTMLFNLRGGLNLKDRFSIGGYFNTSSDEMYFRDELNPDAYLDYWTAGGFMEYTLFPKKLIHLTIPVFFGYGEVGKEYENQDDLDEEEGNFFQIEPSALLEINLHKYVRFNLGAGYRFLGQINHPSFDQSDLSGLTGYLGLRLGLFR
jgi:hypothetical protein